MNPLDTNLKIIVHKNVYLSYSNTYLHNINTTLTYLPKYYIGEMNFIFIDTKNQS